MTFARAWLRLELRRRWRSLAVLALLVAIAVGVVVTAVAAARRGASALTRLQAKALPATVDVLPNAPGFDWSKVRALPEVASFSNFVVDYTLGLEGVSSNGLDFPFLDDAMQSTMERPVILAGRAIDQRRVDEVLVTPHFVDTYHKGVGSTLVLDLPSAKQLDASFAGSDPKRFAGPRVTLHVVGVGISPWFVDAPDLPGGIQLSPALSRRYRPEIAGTPGPQNTQFINALVRLRHGAADVSRFRDDLARVTGRDDIFVGDVLHDESVVQRTIAFESRCLVAFALAALLAALVLVGQAVARYAASSATEVNTLRGLGLTPRGAVVAASAAPLVSGALGAVLGAVGAYFASAGFPFGTAYYYETARGRSLDLPVSAGAVLLAVVLVGLGAAGAARRAVRTRTAPATRSVIAAAAVRSGLPVPVVIGTRFALERGTGRSAVPVRPALVGSVVGVLGTIAAFTFSHAVSDAAHDPVRFGVNWRLVAFVGLGGHDFAPTAAMYHALAASREVTAVADSRTAVATNPAGTASIALWEFENRPKPIHIVLLSGRPPRGPDEIALAPRTLAELHAHVGQTVALRGNRGHRYRIVGSALVPAGPHNEYADGGWVTTAGYDALFTGFKFHIVLIQTAHAGPDEAQRLTHSIASAVQLPPGIGLVPPDGITEAVQLRQVEVLPVVLGSFLALLAIGAVGHALAAAVRRRSRDLAVLRTVGMTPRQCRLVVVTHATVLALFGLAFGVPLGIAAGRTVWRAVADYTPIEYVSPLAGIALVLVGPVAILLANLLAAWPGYRAGRLQVAQVLRAE